MISVAVRGYGIVIWDEEHGWRTFSSSESMSAMLANRVEMALRSMPIDSEDEACEALLTMTGAHLLARSCDHGPGECDSEVGRS
jgi:hypothetical protein